jgi:hypothetical protein
MTALFQLVAEYKAACDRLADVNIDEATIADTLEGERWPLELKAKNVAIVVLSLDAQAKAIKERETQLKVMREAMERRAEHLRSYLADNLAAAEVEKVEGPDVVIGWRKSTAVEIADEAQIPAQYMVQKPPPPPAPDKALIATDLKAGKEIPGARLAHRRHLSIR